MPFFSLVIPAYNQADLLGQTIASVLNQTFGDFELIIIDDASPDPSVASVIREAASRDPRIHPVLNTDNKGLAATRNAGLSLARGTYIIFLDHDDLYQEETLQAFHETILKHGHPAFVAATPSPVLPGRTSTSPVTGTLETTSYEDYFNYRTTQRNWWFVPSGTALLTSLVQDAGGFWDSRLFCEDIDLWQRMGLCKGFVRITSPPLFHYRLHDANNHRNTKSMGLGLLQMISRECSGAYPGGPVRKKERISILCLHGRKVALECSRDGFPRLAAGIYGRIMLWNIRLGRWLFLLAGPCLMMWTAGRRALGNAGAAGSGIHS